MQLLLVIVGLIATATATALNTTGNEQSVPLTYLTTTSMTAQIASSAPASSIATILACCGDTDEGYKYPCGTPEPTAAWSCTALSSTCSGDGTTSTCIVPSPTESVMRQATPTSAVAPGLESASSSATASTMASVDSIESLSSNFVSTPLIASLNATSLNTTDHAVVPQAHEQSCTMEDRDIDEGRYTINIGFTWDDAATRTCLKVEEAMASACSEVRILAWKCNPNTGKGYATIGFDCVFGKADKINSLLGGLFPQGDLMYTGFNCPDF